MPTAHFRCDTTVTDPVAAIAAARTTGQPTVRPSTVYRELLAESLDARRAACTGGHVGPVRDDLCGHCGTTTQEQP